MKQKTYLDKLMENKEFKEKFKEEYKKIMKSEHNKGLMYGLIIMAIWLSIIFVFCALRYSHATIAIPITVGIVWSLKKVFSIWCENK